MKKLIIFTFSFIIFISYANSKVFFGERIKIENIKEEIFALGNKIQVNGELGSEFIGIGESIISSVKINGDYIGIGSKQELTGETKNDVYLLGSDIEINGKINGSLSVFGKNVLSNCNVSKNLRMFGEKIIFRGNVKGNTIIWGENISLGGNFKNLVIHTNKIKFKENSIVNGNLVYYSTNKMDFKNVKIRGKKIWKKPVSKTVKEKTPFFKLKSFYNFFSLLFPFLFMLWLTPNLLSQTATYSGKKFFHCFGIGLVFILIILIVVPIIFVTIIGIPFGLIVSSIFISFLYISRVFPLIFVGRKILFKLPEKRITWFFSTFIGILIFTLISKIPDLKLILNLITVPAGFGAIILGRIDLFKKLKKEKFL